MSFRISILSCIFKPNAIASVFQYNSCFNRICTSIEYIILEFKPGSVGAMATAKVL